MLNLKNQLRINKEEVAAKVIDGEAIMINLSNGTYYSMSNVGAFIWEMIEGKLDLGEMAETVAAHYDVSPSQAQADIERLAAELVQERLIIPAEKGIPRGKRWRPELEQMRPYESPQLVIYRDMADLLALDPPTPGLEYTPWE
jgi:hypothetical protein